MKKIICEKCIQVHGRDTNQAIQCPTCNQIVGCFWHRTGITHVIKCKEDAEEVKKGKQKDE